MIQSGYLLFAAFAASVGGLPGDGFAVEQPGAGKRGAADSIQQLKLEQTGYEKRRNYLIGTNSGGESGVPEVPRTGDRINCYGSYAAMMLRLGFHIRESNEVIREVAAWFEKPHIRQRDLRGEVDFTALELARTSLDPVTKPLLELETQTAIRAFFLNHDFNSMYGSENHALVFWTARYLMANALQEERFEAYGKSGRELVAEDGERLKAFIRYRARRGWGEFDAGGYQFLVINTLLTIRDFSPDPELTKLADMMVNLLLADAATDSLNGLYGGARGRTPESSLLNHAHSVLNEIQYLYFGIGIPSGTDSAASLLPSEKIAFYELLNYSLFSSFRPNETVVAIACDRATPYVNKERKHLHHMGDLLPENPLPGSIRKYTYCQRDYILGSVQLQDPYPEDLKERVYAKHQQHDWDFTVASGPAVRIFTHHPGTGGMHTYWRGGGEYASTFQHRNVVLALWDIPETKAYQYIHAYLPVSNFDEVTEVSGWIFARKGDVYAGLYLDGGYKWVVDGKWKGVEVISEGSKKASVFEAGDRSGYQSFEDFQRRISSNTIRFDTEKMELQYASALHGTITIDNRQVRRLDQKDVNLEYATYESPYMSSRWDSGIVVLKHRDQQVIFDFN